jgi:hypothetical protein
MALGIEELKGEVFNGNLSAENAPATDDSNGISLIDLAEILDQHKLWVESGGESGSKADLCGVNLAKADLTGVNLQGAHLHRLITRGNYSEGDRIPGGGVVVRGFEPGFFAVGLILLVSATALIISAGVKGNAASGETGSIAAFGEGAVGTACLLGGMVPLIGGIALVTASFEQPRVTSSSRASESPHR